MPHSKRPRPALYAALCAALHVAPAAGVQYKQLTFIITKWRDPSQDMVQLSELEMLGSNGAIVRYSSESGAIEAASAPPVTSNTEGAQMAVDGDWKTKWLDTNPPNTRPTLLILEFKADNRQNLPEIIAFRFVTGNDEPDRDPVSWFLNASKATIPVEWDNLHTCLDCTTKVPAARGEATQWFYFPGYEPDGGEGGGCGGGCVFMIIFFCGGFTYFAAGAAINYKWHDKRGVEMVPHLDFWKDVPHLIKDGATFAARKVSSRGGYATV